MTTILNASALAAFVLASMGAAPPPLSPAASQIVAPRSACADLTRLDLVSIGGAGSRVLTAREASDARGQPACVVEGRIAPTIGFRIELPTRSWTGRYLQTGCGGLCGDARINVGAADGCPVLKTDGFVLASTDMGHSGQGTEWTADPQKRTDFAWRGVHLTALAAKAAIRAFYGRDARHSYFDGCSDGGREALVEAQRFPDDFDGIIAGAPAMAFTVQNSLFHGWQARSNTGADGKAILVADRLPILHAAVLKACDAQDGVTDGLLSTPSTCRFDPAGIVCRAGADPATCLTAGEAAVARRFYDGPRDPRTGERLTQGGPLPGSELQWAGVYVPRSADQPIFSNMIVAGAMGTLISPDGRPATVADLRFDRATFDKLSARHTLYDATSPDLAAFRARGGKLILFHGLADPHISPLNTVAYHEVVRRHMGARVADGFERLYLLPGMGHCSGGEGPSAFDLLTPLMDWVERGVAPGAIETRTAGQSGFGQPGAPGGRAAPDGRSPLPGATPPTAASPTRSRPVYPYPFIAAYRGTGNADVASNWRQGRAVPVAVPAWAGSRYFAPYAGAAGQAAPRR